jgi:hypothetical protein
MKLQPEEEKFLREEVTSMRRLIAERFGNHVADVFTIGFQSLINKDKLFYAERFKEQRLVLFAETWNKTMSRKVGEAF